MVQYRNKTPLLLFFLHPHLGQLQRSYPQLHLKKTIPLHLTVLHSHQIDQSQYKLEAVHMLFSPHWKSIKKMRKNGLVENRMLLSLLHPKKNVLEIVQILVLFMELALHIISHLLCQSLMLIQHLQRHRVLSCYQQLVTYQECSLVNLFLTRLPQRFKSDQ